MSKATIITDIRNLLADRLELRKSQIQKTSLLWKDLGMDSLDRYELLYALEEEYGITIKDDEIHGNLSVADVASLVIAKKGKA